MIRLVLIGVGWVIAVWVIVVFFKRTGILNKQWDRDSEMIGKEGVTMSEEKTIRCTKCYGEFSKEETKNVSCCPKCGSKGLPMLISQDVEIKINWHELRILCIWAENWAEAKFDQDSRDSRSMLEAMMNRLDKYRPEGGAALTLTREVKELQEVYPETILVRGDKVLVSPMKVGKA